MVCYNVGMIAFLIIAGIIWFVVLLVVEAWADYKIKTKDIHK